MSRLIVGNGRNTWLVENPSLLMRNGFGRLHKGSVVVPVEEAMYLWQKGFATVQEECSLLQSFSDSCRIQKYMMVSTLKDNNFLLSVDEYGVAGHGPGLRTKALLASEPTYNFHSVQCEDAADFSAHCVKDNETRQVVAICDSEGVKTFLEVLDFAEQEFRP